MTSISGTMALIVAAGSGSRAGGDIPKQYRIVGGKSVLAHAIDSLASYMPVQVVIGAGQEALYAAAIGDRPLPPPVIGGARRRDSVLAGLAVVTTERVFIHDAARPFVPAAVIDRLVAALDEAPGAIPGLPVVDTLALAGPPGPLGQALGGAIDRDTLLRIQTPQAFRTADIIAAHAAWPADREATDDAQVLRNAGGVVIVVAGDRALEKLTYESDFDRIGSTMTSRTGLGFDVHAFGGEGPLWLCGVSVPHERGLVGHSDADVPLHALTDALLGAAALGDIGDHFPPSDPRWKGASSGFFLQHAASLIIGLGGTIDHVDVTIICEKPKIGPFRDRMRDSIANLLRVDRSRVSVKATTTERLGFTGREEGIAAQAIATIRLGTLTE